MELPGKNPGNRDVRRFVECAEPVPDAPAAGNRKGETISMKKTLAVLLVLALCAGTLCTAAGEPCTENLPVAGLSFAYPQAFADAKGMIGTDGAMSIGSGIYYAYWYYCAATQEEFLRLQEEDPDALRDRTDLLFYTFSLADGQDLTAVSNATGWELEPDRTVQLGAVDSWTFWLCMAPNPDFGKGVSREYADEYRLLCGMKDEIAAAFTCSVPFNEYGRMDMLPVVFSAKDLDGNPVASPDLFAQHKVTMVNIWATWCGPCIGELAELQAIHTRFLDKDCAVLGLLIDDNPEGARALIAENGITYPVVIAGQDFSSIFPFDAVPTSFFVDSTGAFLGTKITGASPDLYETALEPLLEAAGKADQ